MLLQGNSALLQTKICFFAFKNASKQMYSIWTVTHLSLTEE